MNGSKKVRSLILLMQRQEMAKIKTIISKRPANKVHRAQLK